MLQLRLKANCYDTSRISLLLWGPLSDTNSYGNPNTENNSINVSSTWNHFVQDIILTSQYFEYASLITNRSFPSCFAKSMCTLSKGSLVDFYFEVVTNLPAGNDCWHTTHPFTNCSMSSSINDHQTYRLAIIFIRTIPVCHSCRVFDIENRNFLGITTLLIWNRHFDSIDKLFLFRK